MNPQRSHGRYINALFLFFFLFSANALCYGFHFIDEFGHDHTVTGNTSENNNPSPASFASTSNHHHNDTNGDHHEEEESCCDSHSHSFLSFQPHCISHIPSLSSRPTLEPFQFIPDVYLDKPIRPQNLI